MLIDKMKTEITRFTWEVTKDFGVADTSHVVSFPIWGSDYVLGIYGRVKTAFAGITGPFTMKIGTSGDDDSIMVAKDLSEVVDFFIQFPVEQWPCLLLEPTHKKHANYDTTSPIITFTSDSGNLEDLTAGEVELVVVHIVPDR